MNERVVAFFARFRLTGRQWMVAGAALSMALAVFWMFWGNFDIGFSRFFAGQEPLPPSTGQCGPPVSQGGEFRWGFRTSEPWDDCVEGKSNVTAAQYWVRADVSTCHPNDLHLVWRASHRPKATCNLKNEPVDIEYEEGKGIITDNGNFDDSNNLPDGESGTALMTYLADTTNCGSVHIWGAFWASGPESSAKNAGYTGWHKVVNYGTDCSAATPSATPTPEPLSCNPSTQTIAAGGVARATATGGDKRYTWDITGGGELVEGGMETIAVKYPAYGTKGLAVRSAGLEAVCTVVVTGSPSPTPTPQDGDLSVTKTGSIAGTLGEGGTFVEVYDGQTVQFVIRIENNGTEPLTGLTLTDEVPDGMSYVDGSTEVEGLDISNNSIVETGLVLGRLDEDDSVTIRWRADADQVGTLPQGPSLQRPAAVVSSNELDDVEVPMDVNVYGTGENLGGSGSGGAGSVATGPDDAVLLALLAAAAVAFLYAGYTRSELYHRREVERMTRERDPLDFRS